MTGFDLTNILFFDTETTGVIPKGAKYDTDFMDFPRIVSLSWDFNGKEFDYIVKPDGWIIPEESIKIHGITNEIAQEKGHDLVDVLELFMYHAELSSKIVNHNIYFDTAIVKAEYLRGGDKLEAIVNPALDKSKRICTMMKTIKFVGKKQEDGKKTSFPSLIDLHEKLFNESFPAHNSMEDVRAVKKCFIELVKLGVIVL